ncbi:hypothetical protein ELS17_05340 [Natrinema altunense]|uniref:Uncharacterized protein n=1 Tax=Natrinema altunense TaxID=222984 RepID=A0A482Y083_9EURY|nr:hypothetical protein ELS17_05340 [Natrinema altunense]
MISSITLHCDCGTDVRLAPTDHMTTCPDCETTVVFSLVEDPAHDTHAPSTRNGSRSYRGP